MQYKEKDDETACTVRLKGGDVKETGQPVSVKAHRHFSYYGFNESSHPRKMTSMLFSILHFLSFTHPFVR